MHGLMSYRRFDVSEELGRYVATELWIELGRYVTILLELLSDDSRFFRKAKFRCGDGRSYITGADSDFSGRSAGLRCRSSLLSGEVSSSPSRERKGSSWRRVTVLFCTGRPLAGSVVPDALALPAGSSTTLILVEDMERAADSMPPPPARKEIVLALHAPSVVPVTQPKDRKRKFTKGGDGESSQQGGSSIASGLRGKFVSLIDGMISECSSETSSLAGELLELQGELERYLGKTASSLLKEKKARKAKSSEVCRLQRQIEIDAGLGFSLGDDRGRDGRGFQSETPPTLEAEEAQLSGCKGDLAVVDGDFDLILADLKSTCLLLTCSEGPEGKDPVLGGEAAPGLDEATGEEGA
ncbi:hypothetical protein F2Q69_00042729 [Brassica cretica]|uniref:Uncharacterized protein n=1 Tax=Brassica cretica TaxID=69181 RepID=A0A8S9NFM5_BRACR|nr:hypothetical protein F2Q69_00042729 [Brassica cretica]